MCPNFSDSKIEELSYRAAQLRIDSIKATTSAGSGHPSSCMSAAEIISTLFFQVMNISPQNYTNQDNDRFILSKGHAAPALYAAFRQLGIISDQDLLKLRTLGSLLEGHPTPKHPLVEAATGSLGQGLAIGVGMALHAKRQNKPFTTYVLMGDGELAEGSVWEAAELAAHNKLHNIVGIVDCNKFGQTGPVSHNHDLEHYSKKFEAFGWSTYCIDGHNINELVDTFKQAKTISNKPVAILAKTYKGYGSSSIANKNGFHGKPFSPKNIDSVIAEIKSTVPKFDKLEQKFSIKKTINIQTQPNDISPIKIDIDKSEDFSDLTMPMATRRAFGIAVRDLGCKSNRIVALDGDVSNSTFTCLFAQQFPDRFTQCFISEQAMIGIATGMQTRGDIPFAATFGAFMTRAHDQIRMAGVGRNALRLCGSHAGVSIGQDGPSQMGLEDIAMMRAIPNSIVLYPSDAISTYKLVEQMANHHSGISYIRTTRSATPALYKINEEFPIGRFKILKRSDSDRLAIISAGITIHEALKAYDALKLANVNIAIIDLYSIKPINEKALAEIASACDGKILTVEDHYAEGGLGEAVCSALSNTETYVYCNAVRELPGSGKGSDLMKAAGIDAKAIETQVRKILKID